MRGGYWYLDNGSHRIYGGEMSNQFTLAQRLTDYRDWMIARMTEGGMIDFSQAERERIFGDWCGYNLFVRLLDAMIEGGYKLPLDIGTKLVLDFCKYSLYYVFINTRGLDNPKQKRNRTARINSL